MPVIRGNRSALILLAVAATVAGCSAQRAHTVPFDGSDTKGIVYSVPKTYLSITLQYAYTRDELRPGPAQAHLQGALKMSPILVPDEKSTFLIKTDGLMSNAMFLTSLNFRFNHGTLESVDATSVDRTAQVIEELGTTAVNIAKAAAKGGDATPHDRAMLAAEKRVDEIYAAIAQAATQPLDAPRNNGPTLDALQKELDVARKLILDLRNNVDPPLRTFTAPLTLFVDPDLPTRQTPDYLEYEVKPPQLFPEVPEDNMDAIYIRIYDDGRRELTGALHAGRRPRDAGGIIYRQPVALMTKILAGSEGEDDKTEVFSGLLPYAQFAPPSVAVLDSKMMTSKHTSLVLDTVNGGLVSFGDAQDSAISNAAQSASALSNAVVQAENATGATPSGRGATSGTTRSGGAGSRAGSTTRGATGSTATSQPAAKPTSQPTTRSGRGGASTSPGLP